MYLLLAFACIFSYKLISNLSRMLMVRYYQNKYEEYIKQQDFDFSLYTSSLKKLFLRGGVQNSLISFTQPAGYGYIESGHAKLFDNMGSLRQDVAALMFKSLSTAEGTYRTRLFECFSPLYWIESVIFLPKNFIAYLGLNENSIAVKLLQVVYWIVTPLLIAFRVSLYEYISQLISKM